MSGTPLNTMNRVSITAPTATKKIAAVASSRFGDARAQDLPRHLPPHDADRGRNDDAEGGGFGRGGNAAVDGADHPGDQQRQRPDAQQDVELLPQRGLRIDGRREARIQLAADHNHRGVDDRSQQTGNEAGEEQLADRLAGEDAVDDHQHTWRNQRAKSSGAGDGSRGQALVIAGAQHFRHRDPAHGDRGGDTRT